MIKVTLYTRVWIEIIRYGRLKSPQRVTLYTRVWIEICRITPRAVNDKSPSTRGCGLKLTSYVPALVAGVVTLYTRVWIEICVLRCLVLDFIGHPLHEGVD